MRGFSFRKGIVAAAKAGIPSRKRVRGRPVRLDGADGHRVLTPIRTCPDSPVHWFLIRIGLVIGSFMTSALHYVAEATDGRSLG
jgi:hypothetical protein